MRISLRLKCLPEHQHAGKRATQIPACYAPLASWQRDSLLPLLPLLLLLLLLSAGG
jgi:hypothetical protein